MSIIVIACEKTSKKCRPSTKAYMSIMFIPRLNNAKNANFKNCTAILCLLPSPKVTNFWSKKLTMSAETKATAEAIRYGKLKTRESKTYIKS